jgi:hypothetical protein
MANGVWRQTGAKSRWPMADSISQRTRDVLCLGHMRLAMSYQFLFLAISYKP